MKDWKSVGKSRKLRIGNWEMTPIESAMRSVWVVLKRALMELMKNVCEITELGKCNPNLTSIPHSAV